MEDETQPLTDCEAQELARGAVRSALGLREGLRRRVRPSHGETAPTASNGHHVKGLFQNEPDVLDTEPGEFVDPTHLLRRLDVITPEREVGASERAMFFRAMFREEQLTLEDNTPLRVRAAWRIVRELARISGLVSQQEKLEDMDIMSPCPWTLGGGCRMPGADEKTGYLGRVWPIVRMLCDDGGLPLLPPPVPSRFVDADGVKSNYDPSKVGHDPVLLSYVAVISAVSKYLGIHSGSVEYPDAGKLGMYGLEDPHLVRLAFPSRLQIMACEDLIVAEALELLVKHGTTKARKQLELRYGMVPREAKSALQMAMTESRERLSASGTDEERSLMVLRLEAYIDKCGAKSDLRSELGALKQLTVLLGLNKADPDDIMKEFVDIVASVASKSRTEKNIVHDVMRVPALITDGYEGA